MGEQSQSCYYCEGSGYLMRTPKKSRKSLIKCLECDGTGRIQEHSYVKWDREKVADFCEVLRAEGKIRRFTPESDAYQLKEILTKENKQ